MSGNNVISKPKIAVREIVERNNVLINHKSLIAAKWLCVLQFPMPHKMIEEILYGLHISVRNGSTEAGQEKHKIILLSIYTKRIVNLCLEYIFRNFVT
jgi:hypothetical protein